jgi:dolichol-phosphate mannosyltransferase
MNDDVCILIPTLNEEKTIAKLIADFKTLGYDDVLVMDGNSTDNTVSEAKKAGARVVLQTGKGKGTAVKQAFNVIEKDITVMIDGDGTYLPEEVNRLIAPIRARQADHVMGNRFAKYEKGAFTRLNLLGNKILNFAFNVEYHVKLSDILTGYRAFSKKFLKTVSISQTGFGIEAELTVETVKKDMLMAEVPITYLSRVSGAPTKLNPLEDGFKIGYTIYRLGKTYNPLLYFNIMGMMFMLAGGITGVYIVLEWLRRIDHIPLTILATLLILTGIQLFILGYLGDMIVQIQREMLRELRKR